MNSKIESLVALSQILAARTAIIFYTVIEIAVMSKKKKNYALTAIGLRVTNFFKRNFICVFS
jgi:hypothetical protein